ncbi:MAG TPA: glycosyltransferase family 4 protein [Solirubrobacteraceae bacterium]|nr:glycosyltransferase family 4 protein [Solirubrobacteraceae bacterium]
MKPVLLVHGEVPPDRVALFRALHQREGLLLARFRGERLHATRGVEDPGVPVVDVRQREVGRLAREARAVIAGTSGRVALPAAYLGARRARVPFVLWTALWSHPRTLVHTAGRPFLHHLYRHADAVATYGEHVSAFVAQRGARDVHVAPQAVEGPPRPAAGRREDGFRAVFVGRVAREKGIFVLLEAWRRAGVEGELVVVGPGAATDVATPGVRFTGAVGPEEVRNFLAAASVLVMPSIATRTFREPWGLVANEAMHQHVPVIATDAVGAAAGGLVRHERNGLVVPERDADALAGALRRMARDATLRRSLGANAGRDVAAFTPEAWAAGMAGAVQSAVRRRTT